MPKDKKVKSKAEQLREEFYKGMAELRESQKRADEELRESESESEKKRKKWREEWDKGMTELRESQKKTDEQMKKTDEELTKLFKKTDKQISQITDGFGKFTEGLVEPNVIPLFKQFGIDIAETAPRVKRYLDGETMEVDILAKGKVKGKEDIIIFIEAKTDPSQRDVRDVIRDIDEFFKFFDEYKGRKVIGAIAGIKITQGVKNYAEKCGLYVLAPSGDTMIILNKPDFKPKIWW